MSSYGKQSGRRWQRLGCEGWQRRGLVAWLRPVPVVPPVPGAATARGRADADARAGWAVGGGPCPWSPGCRSLVPWSCPGRRFARSLVAGRGLVAWPALARYQAPPSRGIGRRLIPSPRALGFTYISDNKEGLQVGAQSLL